MISKISFSGMVSILTIFIVPLIISKPKIDIKKISQEGRNAIVIEQLKLDALLERMVKKSIINADSIR